MVEMVKKVKKNVRFSCKKGNFFVFDVYYPFYYPGSKRIMDKRITDSEFAPDYPGPPDIRRISGASLPRVNQANVLTKWRIAATFGF